MSPGQVQKQARLGRALRLGVSHGTWGPTLRGHVLQESFQVFLFRRGRLVEPRQHVPHVPGGKSTHQRGLPSGNTQRSDAARGPYLRGSWECISMGLGVPPGPPLVSASMNPRTTVLLLAVPNSSRVYLQGAGGYGGPSWPPPSGLHQPTRAVSTVRKTSEASVCNSLKQHCL